MGLRAFALAPVFNTATDSELSKQFARSEQPNNPFPGPPSTPGASRDESRLAFKVPGPAPALAGARDLRPLRSLTTRRPLPDSRSNGFRSRADGPKFLVPEPSRAQFVDVDANAPGSIRTPTPIVLDTATLRR